jgi:hypothetical protein
MNRSRYQSPSTEKHTITHSKARVLVQKMHSDETINSNLSRGLGCSSNLSTPSCTIASDADLSIPPDKVSAMSLRPYKQIKWHKVQTKRTHLPKRYI